MVGEDYEYLAETPGVADYLRLRSAAGLTPRSAAAAKAGLPQTVAAIVVRQSGEAVGMGRAIGDGLFYQLVDVAVLPEHQGRGLGKRIVSGLMEQLRLVAPAEAYVSLMADGEAGRLYSQYGFKPTAPASIGMAQWIGL